MIAAQLFNFQPSTDAVFDLELYALLPPAVAWPGTPFPTPLATVRVAGALTLVAPVSLYAAGANAARQRRVRCLYGVHAVSDTFVPSGARMRVVRHRVRQSRSLVSDGVGERGRAVPHAGAHTAVRRVRGCSLTICHLPTHTARLRRRLWWRLPPRWRATRMLSARRAPSCACGA